jgi:hypothetical protein
MKYARIILPAYLLLLPVFLSAQPGSSCATPIPLTLDNVIRNYSASSTTGANVLCTDNGSTPVTWFSFTTNATTECPLLTISASDGLACEVAMYGTCSIGAAPLVTSSMCLYDGNGLWAPSLSTVFTANATYYLRIKTSTICTISIGGQYYTPPNDNCAGAFSIGTVGMSDNNSCHTPGPGVTAAQLCAFSLENTAFYQFYVNTTAECVINISNIACDNGANNNNNGFQIGFFSGTCAALNWISCTSGSGTFVQATTPILTAGTKVYVAIDGNAGSNCSYMIGGINILGVLAKTLKNFSGWKMGGSNVLKWTALNETDGYYDLERSDNGTDFTSLQRIKSKGTSNSETNYSFEDRNPFSKSYYRLKQTDLEGKVSVSQIIQIDRDKIPNLQFTITNPVYSFIDANITSAKSATYRYKIVNSQGQILIQGMLPCIKGTNKFRKEMSGLANGQYFLILDDASDPPITKSFIKLN